MTRPHRIQIDLTAKEAEVVATALSHVWREVFDKSYDGDGAILRRTLDALNTVTESRR